MEALSFNTDAGYLEAMVRGYKAGILTTSNYLNLAQCETLEGGGCCCLLSLCSSLSCRLLLTHPRYNTLEQT